ncbi:hypothetical protein B0H63DRAFT_7347 [Podospora didyma]|uniref:RRM domain-containing protein n=1 Tax=Podospora didyma TaxID=330526 RepID=A0AAE0P472_9PEZI|nr:hypothetical protein B0H63DRAFT_7347 [Podospora didyma]
MATRAAPPANLPTKVVAVPPNQTLYVTNLPSTKVSKYDLRVALYMVFSTYGAVLDVVALRTAKMRGQAHIVFKDAAIATQAMRSLNGADFLGREMKITFAKSRSNVIAKLDGSFKPPAASIAAHVEVTDLQQSIFNAPVPGAPTAATTQSGLLPSKPQGSDQVMADAASPDTRGTKRARDEKEDESEESDSDVAMEEDSDDE